MRRSRNNHRENKAKKLILPIKFLAIIIALVVFVVYLSGAWQKLRNSDFFKIKEVLFRGNVGVDLSFLKGENLLSLDIKKESEYIAGLSSDVKSVRLVRVLPDRLFVDFTKRSALAVVKLYRYFCVDSDGVLFDCRKEELDSGLVMILGLDTKIFGPKPGRQYNIKELNLALQIIREVKSKLPAQAFKITEVNVSSPDNTYFMLSCAQGNIIQVKVGRNYMRDKITILDSLIHQQKGSLGNIKYIDLRFKEPAIKFKDAKQ